MAVNSLAAAGPATDDHWVTLPQGRLFARRWSPPPQPGADVLAPIVLFHESLGCVDLWRGFPATLCAATGRPVVAYDRLGFGQSDPRPGMPPMDFVEEEARTSLPALRAQLGIGRYVALGHSVGGGMAVHCAAADTSGDCEALITIAPRPAWKSAPCKAYARCATSSTATPASWTAWPATTVVMWAVPAGC